MQLDIDKSFREIEPSARGTREAMINISNHTTDRGAEFEWATHLRFLAPALEYEDLRYLFEEDADVAWGQESDEGSLSSDEGWCSCNDRVHRNFSLRDRRLELLGPEAVSGCSHYLAVSYCWSSSAQAPYHGEPFVVQENGVWRDLKCPPALMERILGLCTFNRREFIWIDQECIDQDDVEDKQVGIRAMDYVYQRAEMSVAILEVCITEQRHVDALEMLLDAPPDAIESDVLVNIIEVLELITADPWFTRAWCLQEATSGSRSMTMLLRHADHLEIPMYFELGGNVQLDLPEMNNLLSAWLPLQLALREPEDEEITLRGHRFVDWWFGVNVPNVDTEIDIDTRVICNGTEALWYLGKRQNSVISDRLAIMANLCGYDLRLQAAEIELAGHGFAISALTLAVLNGDISVLAGHSDVRDGNGGKQGGLRSDPQSTRGHGFTWCPPSNASLSKAAFLDKEDHVLRIEVVSLSTRGLQVRGCIWIADLELNLSSIKARLSARFDDTALKVALTSGIDDTQSSEQGISVRQVRLTAVTELVCYLYTSGFQPLARQIWSTLRQRATEKLLANSEEVRAYDEASLESIIDVETREHKWDNPLPKLTRINAASLRTWNERIDSFASLQHGFPTALMTMVLRHGRIIVTRPLSKDAVPTAYCGIFDTAQIGDYFLTPRNNFGCESPRREYGWYPMNWRLQSAGDGETVSCRGLVAGNWKVGEECMAEVYLL